MRRRNNELIRADQIAHGAKHLRPRRLDVLELLRLERIAKRNRRLPHPSVIMLSRKDWEGKNTHSHLLRLVSAQVDQAPVHLLRPLRVPRQHDLRARAPPQHLLDQRGAVLAALRLRGRDAADGRAGRVGGVVDALGGEVGGAEGGGEGGLEGGADGRAHVAGFGGAAREDVGYGRAGGARGDVVGGGGGGGELAGGEGDGGGGGGGGGEEEGEEGGGGEEVHSDAVLVARGAGGLWFAEGGRSEWMWWWMVWEAKDEGADAQY